MKGDISYTRQTGFFMPDMFTHINVVVVGAGGIGSFVIPALSMLGLENIEVYDPDIVEPHNKPNQLSPYSSINMRKVDAVNQMTKFITNNMIQPHPVKFEADTELPYDSIVISAVDSMKSRQVIYDNVKNNRDVKLLIDGRIGGENILVYTLDPNNPSQCKKYEETLYTDEEAVELPCTAKSVVDVGFFVAGFIVSATRKFLKEGKINFELTADIKNMIIIQDEKEGYDGT